MQRFPRFNRPSLRGNASSSLLGYADGDGSTLSLDFTTGSLDPRLTFTRTSNATFINSQGYVDWANSNMYWNTAFEGLSGTSPSLTGSGWSYGSFTGGNAVFIGDGTMTVTTTATDRRAIFRSGGFTGNGLRVVASVDVTIASGSLTASQVIVTGTPTNAQHYVNGVIWNSSHPIWNGGVLPSNTSFNIAYATDSLTGSTTSIYFGVGCTSATAGSATFSNPRWTMWNGSGTVPYYPNTSATNNSTADRYKSNDYQGPRFDYNPTTLTPRGLLIEASANNLTKYSEDLSQVSGVNQWYAASMNTPTVPGGAPNSPYGTTSASWKLVATAGTALHVWRYSATFTAADYTFSFWAKAAEYDRIVLSDVGGGRGACSFVLNGNGTATAIAGLVTPTNPIIVPYANGWYRCSVTMTMTAATYGIGIAGYPAATTPTAFGASYNADGTSGVYATMFQTELGSGASSYIPTGASQGSRAADLCVMNDISSCKYSDTNGSMYYEGRFSKVNDASFPWRAGFTKESTDERCFGFLTNSGGSSIEAKGPGATPTASVSQTIAVNTDYKIAWSLNASLSTGEIRKFSNGSSVAVSGATALTVTGTPTYFMFGQKGYQDYFPCGTIKAFKYWPTTLSDGELQTRTT